MRTTPLQRSLAALATTIACLALMATPAAATPHDADITGGEISLIKTGVTYVLYPTPPGSTCPTSTPTLEIDITGTSATVTALDIRSIQSFGLANGLMVFSRSPLGNTAGTLTGTTLTSMTVGLQVDVYSSYDATTCTPTGATACRLGVALPLTGTVTGATASDTFSLVGSSLSSLQPMPTCTAGPSVLIGTTVNMTSPLDGHLTS